MRKLKIDLKNDDDFLSIKNILQPFTQRAYFVGGCVRNTFLNLPCNDYDIEIYDIQPKIFDELMKKLGADGVGKSFFVYKYKKFDLALARYENKISCGHKGFEVSICNDEQDGAKRRDFTINALMVNIFDYSFYDFFGGVEDLKLKQIRHINDQSFKEDSLRILRAIAFACRFDFVITDETLALMKTMDINDLSRERINNELYKIFKTSKLDKAYKYFKQLKLENSIFYHSTNNIEFDNLLKSSQKFIKHDGLFLYLYLNFFQIKKKEFFVKTKIKKYFLKYSDQRFILGSVSDFDLAKISLDLKLCEWLGLWNQDRVEQAKKINLFERKFQSQITAKDLLDQGYNGKELGIELYKIKIEEIKKYLKELR
ncbi:CCA tRNA nucleotidyltransferase [Campylobacter insulaenigrae]|uniref:CCA tRNA nucleotidyltransferase n=1 Tax=Campylobacter insulaenigrae TaxID=260714 RepID=UPI00243279B1|nr:CCA tRNA nucleotidyltransferase [Campylobacter insulaenigrae]